MKKHDGRVVNINKTATKLGDRCLELITRCYTVSFHFGKGKVIVVNLYLKTKLNLAKLCEIDAE